MASIGKRIADLESRPAEPYRITVRFHDHEAPVQDDDESIVINLTWESADES